MQLSKRRRSNMSQSKGRYECKHLSHDDHCGVRDGAVGHREGNGVQGDGGEVCVECGRDCPEE